MRHGKYIDSWRLAKWAGLMWCILVALGCESYDGALMQAIRNEEVGNVKRLLEAGANPKIVPPEEQMFPLEVAAYGGNAEIVALLLAHGAHPDSARGRFTPFAIALENDHPKAAALLVDAGADVNPYLHYDGGTIYVAVMLDFEDLVRKLIKKGADIHSPGPLGTPLHEAAENDNVKMLQLLVEAGADIDRRNEYGDTPLQVAAQRRRWAAMHWLAEHGARADLPNNLGLTPLHTLAPSDDSTAIREVCAVHFDPDQQNTAGETALHIAARFGNLKTITALVEVCGADLNIRNSHGLSPAGAAYEYGQLEAVDLLTNMGGRLR